MKKTNLGVQAIGLTAKAKETIYIPFANDEIVTDVCFKEKTGVTISVVEGFKDLANDDKDCECVNLGTVKTACLIITTTKDTDLSVITLVKQ